MKTILNLTCIFLLCFVLAACGGGGGGETQSAATAVPDTASETAEPAETPTPTVETASLNIEDACTLLTTEAVEAAIGTLTEEPVSASILGVNGLIPAQGCNYVNADGRKIHFAVADYTERNAQLFNTAARGTAIEGLGDVAIETVNGTTVVMLEGRAILQGGGVRGEPMKALLTAVIEALPEPE